MSTAPPGCDGVVSASGSWLGCAQLVCAAAVGATTGAGCPALTDSGEAGCLLPAAPAAVAAVCGGAAVGTAFFWSPCRLLLLLAFLLMLLVSFWLFLLLFSLPLLAIGWLVAPEWEEPGSSSESTQELGRRERSAADSLQIPASIILGSKTALVIDAGASDACRPAGQLGSTAENTSQLT